VERVAAGMAAVRFLSSAVEFTAALLMLKYGTVEAAFKINAVLAFIGPLILLTVTGLGLFGLAGKISPWGIAVVLLGVALIFTGINFFKVK